MVAIVPSLNDSYCLVVFLWLHILGARYIYSFVPYDDWSRSVLGSGISEWFGWERNHYDRLVHLCFGGLWMVAIPVVGGLHRNAETAGS